MHCTALVPHCAVRGCIWRFKIMSDADVATQESLYEELLGALGDEFAAQATGEDTQKYLTRLLTATSEMPQYAYDALAADLQIWYDTSAKGLMEAPPQKVVGPDGYVPPAVEAKPKKTKAPKAPKAAKERKTREPSRVALIRDMVIVNPEIKIIDLKAAATKAGYDVKDSTIYATLTFTRGVMVSAKRMGLFK